MQETILFTVLGPDRPGIVDTLAAAVADAGGNWLESNMSHLGGHFAGIVQAAIPAGNVTDFQEKLAKLGGEGLVCTLQKTTDPAPSAGQCFQLEIIGNDRPGIVRALSDTIAKAGGNVESFESRVEPAPMSGELLFRANIRACFPGTAEVDALADRLADIGDELMLDLAWNPDND